MKQWTGLKLGKEYNKAVYCHPAYLTYMQNISCKMAGWINHKLESRMPGEITSDMQMIPLSRKKWRGTEKPLDEGERGQWKSWLKLNIQKLRSHACCLTVSEAGGLRSRSQLSWFFWRQWGKICSRLFSLSGKKSIFCLHFFPSASLHECLSVNVPFIKSPLGLD